LRDLGTDHPLSAEKNIKNVFETLIDKWGPIHSVVEHILELIFLFQRISRIARGSHEMI
jgi:hypothetical protein